MLKSRYVEDIFVEFFNLMSVRSLTLQQNDYQAAVSFFNVITSGSQLTKNQANFIIKILQKYKMFAKVAGLDYSLELENPEWKHSFRVLDLSKKIFVEKDEDGSMWICLRFPFSVKEQFDKEITPVVKDSAASIWDADRKIRRLKFYNFNLIEIFEFANSNNFEIDDTFMIALSDVEEIWQNSEKILPASEKHFGTTVDLINAAPEVKEWWEANRTCHQGNDLLLAKSMGYPLKDTPTTLLEKIAASNQTRFWLKSLTQLFEVYKSIDGKIAVVLNKSEDSQEWVRNFCKEAVLAGIDNQDIRICFRLDKNEDKGFNQWIKDSGYGGKVESGKIFIFQSKPPKWLFTDNIDVKLIVTNSLYPVPSTTTQVWMDTHTCVCYVGDIKASHVKEKKIVEL